MQWPLVGLALIALIGAAPPALARDLTPEVRARLFAPTADIELRSRIVRVPMRGTDRAGNAKCPYLQAYVNGRGPFTFLYDTGAAYALVSDKVVDAVKPAVVFDRAGQRDVVRLDRLSLGGATLVNVWAIHDDTFGVDGIIGFPTLGASNVLFDFSRREIMVSANPIPMRRGFALPYTAEFNVPTVPLRLGKRTIPILIDTGDDAYALEVKSDELGDAAVEHAAVGAATVMNGATAQPTSVTTLKDRVGLGPMSARHAEIAINDSLPIGDLGYDALRQFRFQIEPKRHLVRFEPLSAANDLQLLIAAKSSNRRRH